MVIFCIVAAGLLSIAEMARPQSSPSPSSGEPPGPISVTLGPRSALLLRGNMTSPFPVEVAEGLHDARQPSSLLDERAPEEAPRHPHQLQSALTMERSPSVASIVGTRQQLVTTHARRHKFNRPQLANFENVVLEHPLEPPQGRGHYREDLALLYKELDPHHGQVAKMLREDTDEATMTGMAVDEWLKAADYQRKHGNLEWHQAVAEVMKKVQKEKKIITKAIEDGYPYHKDYFTSNPEGLKGLKGLKKMIPGLEGHIP